MSDHDLLLAIQEKLDGVGWTPDTLEEIAALMIASGYRIRDNGAPNSDDRDLERPPWTPEYRS